MDVYAVRHVVPRPDRIVRPVRPGRSDRPGGPRFYAGKGLDNTQFHAAIAGAVSGAWPPWEWDPGSGIHL